MNPVHFGTSREPLLGVFHPAAGPARSRLGAVLCPPFGQEYLRSHRAFRQLASQLARSGVAAFRFDYFGTGDSAGASDAGSPRRWIQDIGAATDELKDMAQAGSLVLIGLRLGAALAARCAEERSDIRGLVLWDPVLRGDEYGEELLGLAGPGVAPEAPGVHGFPITPRFREELAPLRVADLIRRPDCPRTLAVVSEPRPDCDELAALAPQSVSVRHIPTAGNWEDMDRLGAALLPQAIIRGIVEWLASTRFEEAA